MDKIYRQKDINGAKFTEELTILTSQQQEEIANYLGIDIKGLSPEKAQEKFMKR